MGDEWYDTIPTDISRPAMPLNLRRLQILKRALLAVSTAYFYVLAIAINYHFKTHGLDHPFVFLGVGLMFVIAIALEAGMTWWHRRKRILWGVLLAFCYALLGFIIAPSLYGDWILVAALYFPLVAVFILGFAYSYSRIFIRVFTTHMRLPFDEIDSALRSMPGWRYAAVHLEKTYRFPSFGEALAFVDAIGVVAQKFHHAPDVEIRKNAVTLRLTTPDAGGVTAADIEIAKEFDGI